jgi:hypothetical protein
VEWVRKKTLVKKERGTRCLKVKSNKKAEETSRSQKRGRGRAEF